MLIGTIGMRLLVPLLTSANCCSNAMLRHFFLPIILLYNYIYAVQSIVLVLSFILIINVTDTQDHLRIISIWGCFIENAQRYVLSTTCEMVFFED